MAVELKPLPPQEAIDFFRSKGLAESFAWEDVWEAEHARAFTVAKAMQRDILEDIRAALDRALAEGATLETFRRELTPILQERGWWGRQDMTDPLTGETREVQLGSPRRLRTIFDVNMRSAYQAGRWQRIQRVKTAMPYLRYVAVGGKEGDGRTRLQHRAWHGTILRADHPWWRKHYPPCGWRCRCGCQQLSLRTIQRRGWTITEDPIQFPPKTYLNRRTGEVTVLEGGIDPGFGFNVGEAYLDGVTPRPIPDLPSSQDDDLSVSSDDTDWGELLPDGTDIEAASAAFLAVLDCPPDGRIITDVAGDRVAIGPALFRRLDGRPVSWPPERVRSLELLGRTLAEPQTIREGWRRGASGRAALVRRYDGRWRTSDGLVTVVAEFGTEGWRCASSVEAGAAILRPPPGRVIHRRTAL